MKLTKEIIENFKQAVINARIDLEQGGKYNWNESLQSCDEWMKCFLYWLEELEKDIIK